MTLIRWDRPQHDNFGRIVDGPWGRYLVRRERPGARSFAVILNGQKTTLGATSLNDAMTSVERAIVAGFPEYTLENAVRP